MTTLADKIAIVTGAASGLGKAITKLYAAHGAKVVAADINEAALTALKAELAPTGTALTTVVTDMAKPDDVERMIQTTVNTYGTLDVLVNNAGITDDFSPVADVSDAIWERVMKINVEGPFRAMRSALRIMLVKQAGCIINIASVGGLNGARAGAAYTASKHALIGLTKNTGYLYATKGIRCNAIAPGPMHTNIASTSDFEAGPAWALIQERVLPGMAMSTGDGDPAQTADIALFLASGASHVINGTVIVADGGWTAY